MNLRQFFSFSRPKAATYADVVADCHAHLLPGIDDGPKTDADAVALVEQLLNLGFRQLAATPHVMADFYPNTPATIRAAYEQLQTALRAAGHELPIHVAAEYLLDEGFGKLLQDGELMTLPGRHVLVEMSFYGEFPQLDQYLFQLQTRGYRPIVAHPERYAYYAGNVERCRQLRDQGALLQVNLLSLAGYYDRNTQRMAEQLIKHQLVDLVGTDAHHLQHTTALAEALSSKAIQRALNQVRNAALFGPK